MGDIFSQRTNTIKLRIDSLKANRVFITALFTIISALSTIIFDYFKNNLNSLGIPILWILLTLICMLYSMFTITDSIHFYTKYLEYSYCWVDEVHGEAYGIDNKEGKAIFDYQRALEADDVGYFYMKLSILFFTFVLGSIFIHLIIEYINENFIIQYAYQKMSIITYTLLFSLGVKTYSWVHMKNFPSAFLDYVRRKPVFESIYENNKTENNQE